MLLDPRRIDAEVPVTGKLGGWEVMARSTVDCWIAQTVLDAGGRLLHNDKGIKRIARVRPLLMHLS